MFDSVGRTNDVEAGRRRAMAAALCAGVVALFVAFAALTGVRRVAGAQLVRPGGDGLVMVELADPGLDVPLPPPPPPPPPPAHLASHATDQMDERVASLTDSPATHQDAASDPAGQQGGVANGVQGGKVGGAVGGDPSGALSDGTVPFDYSRLQLKRRVPFVYPDTAAAQHLGEVSCRVRVSIDEQGIPYHVAIQQCPAPFHDAIRTGLRGWRWYPARVGGKPVRATFLMAIRFVPRR